MKQREIVAVLFFCGLLLGLLGRQEYRRRHVLREQADKEALIALYEEQIKVQSELLTEQEKVHAEWERERDRYLQEGPDELAKADALRAEVQAASAIAGLTPLIGSGLEIRMGDVAGMDYAAANSAQLIHDTHLRFIVDWLKVQEVLGIAINGERVTNQSRIVCNGPTVQVNRIMHGMPYVIEAVCSPDLPASRIQPVLENLDLVRDMIAAGMLFEVRVVEKVSLPAFGDQQMINEAVAHLMPEAAEQERVDPAIAPGTSEAAVPAAFIPATGSSLSPSSARTERICL